MRIIHLDKRIVLENINQFLLIDMAIEDEPWDEANFLIDLTDKWKYSLAVVDNNKIVGFLICSIKNGNLHIHRLAVLPESQGKKIGTKMIQHLKDGCFKLGIGNITLKVRKNNKKAQKFYKQLEFMITSYDVYRYYYTWSAHI